MSHWWSGFLEHGQFHCSVICLHRKWSTLFEVVVLTGALSFGGIVTYNEQLLRLADQSQHSYWLPFWCGCWKLWNQEILQWCNISLSWSSLTSFPAITLLWGPQTTLPITVILCISLALGDGVTLMERLLFLKWALNAMCEYTATVLLLMIIHIYCFKKYGYYWTSTPTDDK